MRTDWIDHLRKKIGILNSRKKHASPILGQNFSIKFPNKDNLTSYLSDKMGSLPITYLAKNS